MLNEVSCILLEKCSHWYSEQRSTRGLEFLASFHFFCSSNPASRGRRGGRKYQFYSRRDSSRELHHVLSLTFHPGRQKRTEMVMSKIRNYFSPRLFNCTPVYTILYTYNRTFHTHAHSHMRQLPMSVLTTASPTCTEYAHMYICTYIRVCTYALCDKFYLAPRYCTQFMNILKNTIRNVSAIKVEISIPFQFQNNTSF